MLAVRKLRLLHIGIASDGSAGLQLSNGRDRPGIIRLLGREATCMSQLKHGIVRLFSFLLSQILCISLKQNLSASKRTMLPNEWTL